MGFRPWPKPGQPSFRQHSDHVLDLLERADEALGFAHALTACSDAGVIHHLERPATLQEISGRLSLDPALAGTFFCGRILPRHPGTRRACSADDLRSPSCEREVALNCVSRFLEPRLQAMRMIMKPSLRALRPALDGSDPMGGTS